VGIFTLTLPPWHDVYACGKFYQNLFMKMALNKSLVQLVTARYLSIIHTTKLIWSFRFEHSSQLAAYVAATVHCNNCAGDRNHSVKHRLPLHNLTSRQIDGLQVLVRLFRSGVTLFRFPPHLPPDFIILLLHCQGTVLYCCYIDFWNEQETKHIMHGQGTLRVD
jgi:hypothetical protein